MRRTFKDLTRIMLVMCMGGVSFFLTSCSSDDAAAPISQPVVIPVQPATTKTIYKASTSYSDFTSRTIEKLSYNAFPESSVQNEAVLPDLYVVRVTDANEAYALPDEKIKLAIRACLGGKTIVLGNPSITGVLAFGARVVDVLEKAGNEELKAESDLTPNSLHHLLNQMILKEIDHKADERNPTAGYNQKAYEAMAIRDGVIYYAHDVDEAHGTDGNEETVSSGSATSPAQGTPTEPAGSSTDPSSGDTPDYTAVTAETIKNFANWIDGKGIAAAAENLTVQALRAQYPDVQLVDALSDSDIANDMARKAQRFVHSFTATQSGKTENVETIIDVWAFCEIDQQIDWYYVRTSVVCNNQQLNFWNAWDYNKTLTPYFKSCTLENNISGKYQKLRTNDCKPLNDIGGKTEYSTGFSVNFGGNVGIAGTGPSAGLSGGVQYSDSKTTSVPDIAKSFTKTSYDHAYWTFTAPQPNPEWSFLSTKCDSPKSVTRSMIVLDTLSVYTLPSSYEYTSGAVDLDTWVSVTLERLYGWLENAIYLKWNHYTSKNKIHYEDYIKKPCNAKGDYIMYFESPDGTTPERIELFTKVLKEVIPTWDGSKKTFYAIGSSKLDPAAKSYFTTLKTLFEKNKAVLKSKGFSGTFKFYIKDSDKTDPASSFEMTF